MTHKKDIIHISLYNIGGAGNHQVEENSQTGAGPG